PIFVALPILWWTARRFALTPLLYRLILLHAVVLMIGGHYTYARVPAGFWVEHALDLSRNPYDRLGHLVQGCVPALIARELLLRGAPRQRSALPLQQCADGLQVFFGVDAARRRHLGHADPDLHAARERAQLLQRLAFFQRMRRQRREPRQRADAIGIDADMPQ